MTDTTPAISHAIILWSEDSGGVKANHDQEADWPLLSQECTRLIEVRARSSSTSYTIPDRVCVKGLGDIVHWSVTVAPTIQQF